MNTNDQHLDLLRTEALKSYEAGDKIGATLWIGLIRDWELLQEIKRRHDPVVRMTDVLVDLESQVLDGPEHARNIYLD